MSPPIGPLWVCLAAWWHRPCPKSPSAGVMGGILMNATTSNGEEDELETFGFL